jgi:hypothetical protein
MIKFIGIPIFIKSVNLYPPAPYTSMWVGEPMGVAKLLLTEIMRAMQNVSGLTPSVVAALTAMGQNIAAVAALLINSVINVATRHMLIRAT